jgi:hypothetical protein
VVGKRTGAKVGLLLGTRVGEELGEAVGSKVLTSVILRASNGGRRFNFAVISSPNALMMRVIILRTDSSPLRMIFVSRTMLLQYIASSSSQIPFSRTRSTNALPITYREGSLRSCWLLR